MPSTVPPTPRWVKIAGIVAAIAIIVVVLLHLTGHTPGMMRH